jgi:hypothetical protein
MITTQSKRKYVVNFWVAWACSMHGEKKNAYRILFGKPERNNH